MKAIGVRELRQRASEFLREVEQGGSVDVTVHGRLIARIVPVRGATRRDTLAARGRLVPGDGDLLEAGPPLAPARQVESPSQLLTRSRSRER